VGNGTSGGLGVGGMISVNGGVGVGRYSAVSGGSARVDINGTGVSGFPQLMVSDTTGRQWEFRGVDASGSFVLDFWNGAGSRTNNLLTISAGGNLGVLGSVTVNSTTASTSTSTGALVVSGGVGVAGAVNVGGNIGLSGNFTITDGVSGHTLTIDRQTTAQNNYLKWSTAGTQNWVLGSAATGTNTDLELYSYGASGRVAKFDYSTKATTLDGALTVTGALQVGNAYVAGAPTATGYIVIKDSTGTSYKIPAVAL
jgi:hypothetical protein